MKKLLTLILVLCSIAGFAQIRGGAQYDPGAARSDLSNVDATATPSMTSITLSDKVKAAWADILGDIYASGTAKVAAGTAAAPAYSFASDPNTGVYSPAADNLAVSVGGVQVATFASTGLGLTSPLTISNGGTGKTTAAEALAALGGASLNGSSTVAFSSLKHNTRWTTLSPGHTTTATSSVGLSIPAGESKNYDFSCVIADQHIMVEITAFGWTVNGGNHPPSFIKTIAVFRFQGTVGISDMATYDVVPLQGLANSIVVSLSRPSDYTLRVTLTNSSAATLYAPTTLLAFSGSLAANISNSGGW